MRMCRCGMSLAKGSAAESDVAAATSKSVREVEEAWETTEAVRARLVRERLVCERLVCERLVCERLVLERLVCDRLALERLL